MIEHQKTQHALLFITAVGAAYIVGRFLHQLLEPLLLKTPGTDGYVIWKPFLFGAVFPYLCLSASFAGNYQTNMFFALLQFPVYAALFMARGFHRGIRQVATWCFVAHVIAVLLFATLFTVFIVILER